MKTKKISYWNKLQYKYSILCPWFWRDLRINISMALKPSPNRWVWKNIPKQWRDIDYIYETILFDGLVNYVEKEKGLEATIHEVEKSDKIKEIYHWVKIGRDELQKDMDKVIITLEEIQNRTSEGRFKLDEINRLEKIMDDTNTKHLIWLVENRHYLWT